jgi:membrane protein DedA with SNARE-associated domain
MPALAGSARMPYRRFLVANALGGIVWGAVVVALGYAAGASYKSIEGYLGQGSAALVAVVVVLAAAVWAVRRHRG